MKLKALNLAMLLAVSSGFPLTTLADTTESPTTNVASQATDLSQPNKPDSTLLSWASSTAVATFTYDSKNYRNEIQKLSGFFY